MTRMKNKRKRMKARLEIIDFSIQYKKMILNYLMQSQMLFSKDYEQNLLQFFVCSLFKISNARLSL